MDLDKLTELMKAKDGNRPPPYDPKEHAIMRKQCARLRTNETLPNKVDTGANIAENFNPTRLTSRLLPTSFGGLEEQVALERFRESTDMDEKQDLVNHMKNCQEIRTIVSKLVTTAKKEGLEKYVSIRLKKLEALGVAYEEYEKCTKIGTEAERAIVSRFKAELARIETNISDWEKSLCWIDYQKFVKAKAFKERYTAYRESTKFRENLTTILRFTYARQVLPNATKLLDLTRERTESEAFEDTRAKNDEIQSKMEEISLAIETDESDLKTARFNSGIRNSDS